MAPARSHPFVNFVPRPSISVKGVNDSGYRSRGPSEDFQGTQVYLAGDCTIFDNRFLSAEQSLGYVLEADLRRVYDGNIEVINAGYSHYTSLHSLNRFIIDVQSYSFDVSILATGINDVLAFVHTGGSPEPDYSSFYGVPRDHSTITDTLPGRYPWLFNKLPSLRLYSLWKLRHLLPQHWIYQVIEIDPSYGSTDNVEKCYAGFHTRYLKSTLRAFISLCRLNGVSPVLMTNYYDREAMNGPVRGFYAYGIDQMNEEIRRTAREDDVLLLDMAKEFPNDPEMIDDKWGFTATGTAERSRIITEFMRSHGLLATKRDVSDIPVLTDRTRVG